VALTATHLEVRGERYLLSELGATPARVDGRALRLEVGDRALRLSGRAHAVADLAWVAQAINARAGKVYERRDPGPARPDRDAVRALLERS
jgi:hypothetical protein